MEPQRQNGDADERSVEHEERNVRVAQDLTGRMQGSYAVRPRHVVIDAHVRTHKDAYERRVGVVGEVCPVVRTSARVARGGRRDGSRNAMPRREDEVRCDQRSAAERDVSRVAVERRSDRDHPVLFQFDRLKKVSVHRSGAGMPTSAADEGEGADECGESRAGFAKTRV
jgi:hypothetical protein